jgi:hypothetical protein
MQPDMAGAGGAILFLFWLVMGVAIFGGYVVILVALWRAMKAHESLAQAVIQIARHLEKPATGKHEADRFTFGE